MKQIINSYKNEYKNYKHTINKKITNIMLLFFFPFLPTAIFYNVSLFVQILFWIFLGILFIFLLILLGFLFFTPERPMYEFLYKDIVDEAFKDDYTHYEYEPFPKQNPFLTRGNLFTETNMEVVKYRLTFYYTNNRIDLYSLYAYSKKSKSIDPVFNGIYYVIHNTNHDSYIHLSNEKTTTKPKTSAPKQMIKLHNQIAKKTNSDVYISGVNKEVHIAINQAIDHLKPKDIDENHAAELVKTLWKLVTYGRKLYRDVEESLDNKNS